MIIHNWYRKSLKHNWILEITTVRTVQRDSVIPESISDTGQNHLSDTSCPVIHGIPEMLVASDVRETRELCTDSGHSHRHPWLTPTTMLTPSTPLAISTEGQTEASEV